MDRGKERVIEHCRRLRPEAKEAALKIGGFAELSMLEEKSAALMKSDLVAHGFEIEREFDLIPNAFVASEAAKALEHLAKLLDACDK